MLRHPISISISVHGPRVNKSETSRTLVPRRHASTIYGRPAGHADWIDGGVCQHDCQDVIKLMVCRTGTTEWVLSKCAPQCSLSPPVSRRLELSWLGQEHDLGGISHFKISIACDTHARAHHARARTHTHTHAHERARTRTHTRAHTCTLTLSFCPPPPPAPPGLSGPARRFCEHTAKSKKEKDREKGKEIGHADVGYCRLGACVDLSDVGYGQLGQITRPSLIFHFEGHRITMPCCVAFA